MPILCLVISMIFLYKQWRILIENQTEVDGNCKGVQKSFISFIWAANVLLILGAIYWIIILLRSKEEDNFEHNRKRCMNFSIYYYFTFIYILVLFITSFSVLSVEGSFICSANFSAVSNLRGVVSLW